MKMSMLHAILTDSHFWVPLAVLAAGIALLVVMILTVMPVSIVVRALLRPLLRKRLDAEVARLEAPSGSSTERMEKYQ